MPLAREDEIVLLVNECSEPRVVLLLSGDPKDGARRYIGMPRLVSTSAKGALEAAADFSGAQQWLPESSICVSEDDAKRRLEMLQDPIVGCLVPFSV